ncbi:hypothetical protein BDW62DRAFT_199556 [Aspergillus aurantiobrunneus]
MSQLTIFDKIPESPEEWRDAASRAGLLRTSPQDFANHRSGSEVTQAQFIVLRTFIKPISPLEFDPAAFDMQSHALARQLLRNSPEFNEYLQSLRTGSLAGSGDFGPLLRQQTEILLSEGVTSKLGRRNEPPVNATLITLLQAIIATSVIHGKQPSVTDGQMQDSDTMQIRVVAECKSSRRTRYAKIKEFPGSQRRFLVSQNGLQLYVTFARYGGLWQSNITRTNPQACPRALMDMYCVGPYLIDIAAHMEEFAAIVLAISL